MNPRTEQRRLGCMLFATQHLTEWLKCWVGYCQQPQPTLFMVGAVSKRYRRCAPIGIIKGFATLSSELVLFVVNSRSKKIKQDGLIAT